MLSMTYDVLVEKKALKQLKKAPFDHKERIKETLAGLSEFPEDLDVKKLVSTGNRYRIRVGTWRIIVEINDTTIRVIAVLPRKKAYK